MIAKETALANIAARFNVKLFVKLSLGKTICGFPVRYTSCAPYAASCVKAPPIMIIQYIILRNGVIRMTF